MNFRPIVELSNVTVLVIFDILQLVIIFFPPIKYQILRLVSLGWPSTISKQFFYLPIWLNRDLEETKPLMAHSIQSFTTNHFWRWWIDFVGFGLAKNLLSDWWNEFIQLWWPRRHAPVTWKISLVAWPAKSVD